MPTAATTSFSVSSSEAEEDEVSAAAITIDSDAGSEGEGGLETPKRSPLGVDAVEASQGHRVGLKNTGWSIDLSDFLSSVYIAQALTAQ